MARHFWVLATVVLSLTLAQLHGDEPATPAQVKLEAARKTFEAYWAYRSWSDVEIPYRWSCRWLEAQNQRSDARKDRIAAFQAHLKRMKALQRITSDPSQRLVATT